MPGKELAGGRWPPDLEGDKRSGVREEREHEESRTAAAAIRSRRGSCSLKPGLGGLIGMTSALGRIQSGPNVSDTRIQYKTYLHFQDTARNISETYPGRIRIRNVSDTDTPPPRSIRVTEAGTPSSQLSLGLT